VSAARAGRAAADGELLVWAWQRASGHDANVWCHERTGRVRVGPEPDLDADECEPVEDVGGRCGWQRAA